MCKGSAPQVDLEPRGTWRRRRGCMASKLQTWSSALCVATCLTAFLLTGSSEVSGAQDTATFPTPYGLHTDDLDGMLKRQNIRALVLINPIGFFYDKGQPKGVNYEALEEFQKFVNQKLKTGTLDVKVTFIPLRPDQARGCPEPRRGRLDRLRTCGHARAGKAGCLLDAVQKDVTQIVVTGPGFRPGLHASPTSAAKRSTSIL